MPILYIKNSTEYSCLFYNDKNHILLVKQLQLYIYIYNDTCKHFYEFWDPLMSLVLDPEVGESSLDYIGINYL